jgi:hypothetical protein
MPKKPDYSSLPATAPFARTLAQSLYFTGRPCKQGHTAPRRVTNHQCRDCHIKAMRKVNKRAAIALKKLRGM